MGKCGKKCEIYSRVCGYFRPVNNWNRGKREEWKERKTFIIDGMNELSADNTKNKEGEMR